MNMMIIINVTVTPTTINPTPLVLHPYRVGPHLDVRHMLLQHEGGTEGDYQTTVNTNIQMGE
jgi:hypothetical protein